MHATPLVSEGHRHGAVLAEVKVVAVVMIVGGDPTDPHAGRILTREYSD